MRANAGKDKHLFKCLNKDTIYCEENNGIA